VGVPVLMVDWTESSMPRIMAYRESHEHGNAD
jgi:hypothetical protein